LSKFLTIKSPSEGIYKEKGSRFLAYTWPVSSEDEIKNLLAALKKDHHKARHICFAYRLGADKANFKYSDDGEPHNSAGFPILGQIKSFDLTNILIAVVRYFGGTKLGLGGLTSAYKDAAKDALEHASIVEDVEHETISITIDYAHLSELMNFIKHNNIKISEQDLGGECKVVVSVAKENVINTIGALGKISSLRLNPNFKSQISNNHFF